MKLTFYGTRGSIPVCGAKFQKYGGNTTCVAIEFANGLLGIIDAGSGIRELGKDIAAGKYGKQQNILMAFTHFHWDHIQGFPFFLPAYDEQQIITIGTMGSGRSQDELREIFETQMQESYFPVPLSRMGATLSFMQSAGTRATFGSIIVDAYPLQHPGGAMAYKFTEGDRSFVFASDVEHGETVDAQLVDFVRGSQLLIHDGQYTPEEMESHRGWGHSSWKHATEVASAAGLSRVLITHHDPDHDDECLAEIETLLNEALPGSALARDGMTLEI